MLKFVKTSLYIAIASAALTLPAHAKVDEMLANICTIVKADDKGELRKKMRAVQTDYNLKIRDYYAGISCDGNSLIRTALLSNAVETGSLIVKKMPGSALQEPEQDGKTLSVWVQENGFENSPITQALKERI